ncbi:MAG: EAL domain-containing protein [Spirulinaceae cyanobacterium]
MCDESLKILLIEDNGAEARLLKELLKGSPGLNTQVVHTPRLKAALEHLDQATFDVILLDLTLPDSIGLTSLDRLLQAAPHSPVIVLTNTNDEHLARETVRHGAQDYLVKRNLQPELLSRAIYYAIERTQVADSLYRVKAGLEQQVEMRTAQLRHAKELAQTTLQSIGEAVITTDAQGRVEMMNPVAVRLTGWDLNQAKGRPLTEVFQVRDEQTRQLRQDLLSTAFAAGASQDYDQLLLQHRDGQPEIAVEVSLSPIQTADQTLQGLVLVGRNVTPTRTLTRQLQWQASHDTLTQLINRREFKRRVDGALQGLKRNGCAQSHGGQHHLAQAHGSQTHVLCYLDLDQFKIVNDTCGHAAGDELLRRVAILLQHDLGSNDCLARLGGDEFGILLQGCSLKQGETFAQQIVERIRALRFTWGDRTFQIGASVGVMAVDGQLADVTLLLQTADTAMYVAKAAGRNRVQVYRPDDPDFQKHQGEMQWVNRITHALAEDGFRLYAQRIEPIAPGTTDQPHYEILLRLQDPHGGLIRPGQFMPAAERFALMPQLDRWVIRTLFAQLARQPAAIAEHIYAINLSGASFNDDTFLAFLQGQLEQYQIPPEMICFEITETVAIANLDNAVQIIQHLRQLGCKFSLDDFGTGMSSLTYLKTLPVDYVKIDGQFIRNLISDPVSATMVSAISQICQVMGLKAIAECVEHRRLLGQLWDLGVSHVQGYGVALPCPLEWVIGHPERQHLVPLALGQAS